MQSHGDHALVAEMKGDWRRATNLSDADRTMLAYAEKVTVNPSGLTPDDLNGLRRHFSEEQTFDIVLIACFFNFVDRIADAFGVELDAPLRQMTSLAPEGEALKEFAAPARAKTAAR